MAETKRGRPRTNGAAAPRVTVADAESSSRDRVIQATIDAIIELGYYQATSNEIARRAGVSWGVIQYYFGTREKLLVAVIADACEKVLVDLNEADISGDTVADRLEAWTDAASSFYAQPGYIAVLQILFDVLRRPGTAEESRAALSAFMAQVQTRLAELLHDVAGDRGAEVMAMLQMATWGFAVAEAFGTSYRDVLGEPPPIPRREYIEALAWMIERHEPPKPAKPARKTRARR